MPEYKIGEPHLARDFSVGISVALKVHQEVDTTPSAVDGIREFPVEPDSVRTNGGTGFCEQFTDVGHHTIRIVGEFSAVDQEHAFIVILRHGYCSLVWCQRESELPNCLERKQEWK